MASVTLEEAQAHLSELILKQVPGEELLITVEGRTVAKLITLPKIAREPRKLGTMKGTVLSMDHFDDPLEEFAEYM